MKKTISLSLCLVCCAIAAAQPAYTLQQLKDSALHNNIAMRNGQLAIKTATEQQREAFTKYFPDVSGSGLWFNANKGLVQAEVNPSEYISPELGMTLAQALPPSALAGMSSPLGISMMRRGTVAGLTAMQPVFAGGQIVNSNRLAKVGRDVARLRLQLSGNEVERQTEQYFWQLVTLQEKLRTVDVVDTLLADIAKDVAVAVRAGVALRNDLLQVQLRQNDVESQRLKLENGIGIVRMLLSQHCGLHDSALRVSYDTHAAVSLPQRHDHQQALAATAEYQLLGKQVEAATLQKKLAVGQSLPTVAVGAGYTYNNLLDHNQTNAMIFATVSVPISDWWGGSHAIRRRQLERQQAIDQLHDNAERLQIRMQNAWNSVMEARAQLDLARRGIEQAEENLRIHRNYYRAGTATMSNLLEAQLLYQQTLDKHTDAFAELQNKLLEYRQSVGE